MEDDGAGLIEGRLRQQVLLFQSLHAIEHSILTGVDDAAYARAALDFLPELIGDYKASSVFLFDENFGETRLLAFNFPGHADWIADAVLSFLSSYRESLSSTAVIQLQTDCHADANQAAFCKAGLREILITPLEVDGCVEGGLFLAAGALGEFDPPIIAAINAVAAALALGVQQTRLRLTEQKRLQEAEAMRDVIAALAGAADLKQTLEIALVNLHNVIEYDRAGLFLGDEARRSGFLEKVVASQEAAARLYSEEDPLVIAFQQTHRPILVQDVHLDNRFASWPDMEEVRGWLGAPLFLGGKMIGFLGLGSMAPGIYAEGDAERLQVFVTQVSEMLEKAWLFEQSRRRTAELEVLSNLTSALGKAESAGSQSALAAIAQAAVLQVNQFFETCRSAFLFPDQVGRLSGSQQTSGMDASLIIKFSLDEKLVGRVHPYGSDILWHVYLDGAAQTVTNIKEFIQQNQAVGIFPELLDGAEAAAFIPLRSGDTVVGILCLVFDRRKRFTADEIQLFKTFAEIAGSSLRRAATLEMLENQVNVQSQHLGTLYAINAVSSEPLDLHQSLQQVLKLMLASMQSDVGAIHLLEEVQGSAQTSPVLCLAAQQNLNSDWFPGIDQLSLKVDFWREVLDSTSPVVLTDIHAEPRFPLQRGRSAGTERGGAGYPRAFIGAPIRSKGRAYGLLSLFGETILDYTIEDITLFMTIADQIGGLVERARLLRLARQAAVIEERQRLARELHDSVTQLLYSQVLFAGAGLKVMRQNNLPLAAQHLERLNQAALQALKEMRLLVYQLHPSDTLDEGLARALERRLEAVEKRTGINIHLDIPVVNGVELNLDDAAEMALYRIAEEALNNMLKHAEASEVHVKLSAQGEWIVMEIVDNGCGFDPLSQAGRGGMGLVNMRERAAALGGTCEWISAPGMGTRVVVKIKENA